jgi:hypothetical protein
MAMLRIRYTIIFPIDTIGGLEMAQYSRDTENIIVQTGTRGKTGILRAIP